MRSQFTLGLLAIALSSPELAEACASSVMAGPGSAGAVYVAGEPTLAAWGISGWESSCALAGTTYPDLRSGTATSLTLDMQVFVNRGGTSPGVYCSVYVQNGRVWTITSYEHARDPNTGATKPCNQQTSILHELGHVLGLDHSSCAGRIMSTVGWNEPDTRTIQSDECAQVWENWLTPIERERIAQDELRCDRVEGGNGTGCGSPLVLDLENDGIQTTSVFRPVTFDLDGDDLEDVVAWLAPATDDGFLALDLDWNGVIDGGRELFGDASGGQAFGSMNGFEALASYDSNLDGKISPHDAIWPYLLVWRDANYNGVSEGGELRALANLGVTSIHLEFEELNRIDGHGNRHRYFGWFVRGNKGRGAIVDIYFDYNPGSEQRLD